MIVPEHVKLPLLKTAAAHGAEETVLPPMIRGAAPAPGSVAASAAAGAARLPVRTVAREATTNRRRTPDSFRRIRGTHRGTSIRSTVWVTEPAPQEVSCPLSRCDDTGQRGSQMQFVTVALLAFVAIVPVELPNKTFVATLVLSTRYRPLPVFVGVVAAFGVQCLVAVLAGTLISKLPRQPVELVAAALFAVGALVLL